MNEILLKELEILLEKSNDENCPDFVEDISDIISDEHESAWVRGKDPWYVTKNLERIDLSYSSS